jgi:hypothetical protein
MLTMNIHNSMIPQHQVVDFLNGTVHTSLENMFPIKQKLPRKWRSHESPHSHRLAKLGKRNYIIDFESQT